jgi:hypothetical protein
VHSKEIDGRRRHALCVGALWALTLLAYSNSFRNGLPLDSGPLILQDPRIHELSVENLKLIAGREYWHGITNSGALSPADHRFLPRELCDFR